MTVPNQVPVLQIEYAKKTVLKVSFLRIQHLIHIKPESCPKYLITTLNERIAWKTYLRNLSKIGIQYIVEDYTQGAIKWKLSRT